MKFPFVRSALFVAGLIAAPVQLVAQPVPAAAPAKAPGPRMAFLTNTYDFGKVNMGQQVNYTFVVSNSGDQTLVISNVRPGCHCTTAKDWTHQVEPGHTGNVFIKFDSGGINGSVTRTITVTSNAKDQPIQTLYLRGTVWREIDINPQTAYMMVPPDATEPVSNVVHIVNRGQTPITLSSPTSATPTFKAQLKTTVPGKEFELTVVTVPPLPSGNSVGTISIKTSSTNVPVLNVTALAMVQPAITIAPMQIVLPPELVAATTNQINITANGKKALALSAVEVCCNQSIKTELKEIRPGRLFQLAAIFPRASRWFLGSGFRLASNPTTRRSH